MHIKFLTNKEKDYQFLSWTPYDNANWEGVSSLKLRPDGFASFEKRGRCFYCFVEIDRGTERGDAIRKKIERYHLFDFSGKFWEEFKHDWFRVLFVTTEASRSAALLKLFPSRIFWTTTAAEMLSRPLFEPCWSSKGGSRLALNLGPGPEQAQRAEERKAALLAASAPEPKAQPSVRRPRSLVPQAPPVAAKKKLWGKNLDARFWLRLAKAAGIACVIFLFGTAFYRIASMASAEWLASESASDPMLKIALIAGILIVVRLIVELFA